MKEPTDIETTVNKLRGDYDQDPMPQNSSQKPKTTAELAVITPP